MTARLAVVAAAVGVLATTGCSHQSMGSTRSTPGGRPSQPTTTRPAGKVDLASAVRDWYQRAASIPEARYFDSRLCGLKQPEKLWLLGGGAPKGNPQRRCAVPAYRPILAPVINELMPVAVTTPNPPALSPPPMDVRLDGRPLKPVWIANRRPYRISAVRGNPIGLSDGEQVADDGYWVFIDPGLAPGRHKLTIHTSSSPQPHVEWTLVAS